MKPLFSEKSRDILRKLFTVSDEKLFTLHKKVEKTDHEYAQNPNDKADFETAIEATKFGKFNILLLLVALPAGWTAVFDTAVMSYVFPAAQCDLSLSLLDKGTLNAIIYAGMITSAFLWGYLADTLGRKNILMFGFLLDAITNVCCSFSQTYWMILVFKYFNGFIVSGPFAVKMSYLSEFHSKNIRSKIIISSGLFFSTANIALPLLAWWIIPQEIGYKSDTFNYHSWNIFILITTIPAFVAAIGFYYLPESPKFLMTTGKNDEAMAIFKKVYAMNTGKDPNTFPIQSLVEETKELDAQGQRKHVITANRSKKLALKEGFQQIKPLFMKPFLGQICIVYTMYAVLLMSMNTLRLWLPQLFVAMDFYVQTHNQTGSTLCEMIDFSLVHINTNATAFESSPEECVVANPNAQVYINSAIVAICSLGGYIICTLLVDILGKKLMIFLLLIFGGSAGIANYWSTHWIQTLAFSSTHVSLIGIACTTLISALVEIFPTTLRSMAISLAMMCGRLGSIIGNVLFPYLIQLGCLQPFLLIGGTVLACTFLTLGIRSTSKSTFR